MKKDFTESCSSNLIILRENHFQKDWVGFWPSKLTLNFKNALFLSVYFYSVVTVGKDLTIQDWSVFKTDPLVKCANFYYNLAWHLTFVDPVCNVDL